LTIEEKILKTKRRIINAAIPILIIYLLYINGWLHYFSVIILLIISILLFFSGIGLIAYIAKKDIEQMNKNKGFCEIKKEEEEAN